MALETVFTELYDKWTTLATQLEQLLWSIREAKPTEEEHTLTNRYEDAVTDMVSMCKDGITAVTELKERGDMVVNLPYVGRTLTTCQEKYNRIAYKFSAELVSYERIQELDRFARGRNREWRKWAKSLREELGRCQHPLYGVNQALFSCLQEISERLGFASVSVQATNIGQQIKVPDGKEGLRNGLT
jgi:hypothetical protein